MLVRFWGFLDGRDGVIDAAACRVGTLLDLSELPAEIARPVPMAFYFWQAVWLLAAIWLVAGLWTSRKAIAASAVAGEPGIPVEETKD